MKKIYKDDLGNVHFESDDGSVMTPEEFIEKMKQNIEKKK